MPGRATATVDAASLRADRAVGARGAPGDAAADPAAQRARRKADLAACLRIFGALGFSHGAIGHVTARDPVDPSLFWVNPYRRAFRTLEARDLLLVDAAGGVVEGSGSLNPPAYLIHSRIHAARPDVVAAAHVHSPSTVAWSAVGRPLGPITQDSCVFFERQALCPTFGGVVDSAAEAERVGDELMAAGYRGFERAAVAYGDPESVAEQLAVYGELGFTDVVVRVMRAPLGPTVRSVELAGEVRSRLARA